VADGVALTGRFFLFLIQNHSRGPQFDTQVKQKQIIGIFQGPSGQRFNFAQTVHQGLPVQIEGPGSLADSATFVLGMMTSGANSDPSILCRFIWGNVDGRHHGRSHHQ
jgi:choline-glycine betaine transporter